MVKFSSTIYEIIIRRRWLFVALVCLGVFATLPGLKTSLVPDNALTVWFVETDPALLDYQKFHEYFGNDEVILVRFKNSEGVINLDFLTKIRQWNTEVEKINGVDRVISLDSARDIYSSDDGISFGQALPDKLPETPEALEALKKRLTDNLVFRGRLISADATQTMVWVQMESMADIDIKRDAIVKSVYELTDEMFPQKEHAIGGMGVVYSALNVITQHDFGFFISICYLLMFGALWVVFRQIQVVLAAMGVIILGTIACLGVYGLAGHQLNGITVVLPTLIVVLGVADAVHFPSSYFHEARLNPGLDRFQLVLKTLERTVVPCLFTTLTTIAGFLALTTSPMAVVRHLGLYAAIGLAVALVAAVALMSVFLFRIPVGTPLPEQRWLADRLKGVESKLLTKRPLLWLTTLCLLGVSIWGLSLVVTDTYVIGYLPEDHRVTQDNNTLEAEWGYYTPLEFLIVPAEGVELNNPDLLNSMGKFARDAVALDGIRLGYSLETVYRQMALVLGAKLDPNEPMPAPLIAQLGLILEMEELDWDKQSDDYDNNFLAPLQTEIGDLGRLTVLGKMASAKELESTLGVLEKIGKQAFGDSAALRPSGYPPLYVTIINYVVESQLNSFFLALLFIFLLMLFWLRSFRLAIISLFPNVFPVLVMAGVMGHLGVNLDVGTATVAAIVLGVAIDDTIHFLHYWREAELSGKTWEDCVSYTFDHAGVPAVITTLLLLVGYPVLMLADASSVFYFGLLTSISAVAALYADLVLLPLLLRLFFRKAR